jgi:thymidine phosphorylase
MLKIKKLGFDTAKDDFCYINKKSPIVAKEGFAPTTRIIVGDIAAELVLIESDIVKIDEIGLSNHAFKKVGLKEDEKVKIKHIPPLKSFDAIKRKIAGKSITEQEMCDILKDIAKGYYSKAHIATFCSVFEQGNASYDEISFLTEAMVKAGNKLTWNYDIVVDKHCIGGISGNRTTNVAIPIIAAYGLHIPKTSSRAITSPSGTADTMEVLCDVNVEPKKMQKIIKDVGGCIVWGGSVDLSPADDLIINVKKLLNMNSEATMIASVLSKKLAAGSTHMLIVIPVGPTAKAKDMNDYRRLRAMFESIGKDLGSTVVCAYEEGIQPIGNGIGPALEAKDIIKLFKNEKDAPQDLKKISLELSGKIIEFDPKVKKGDGVKIATEILESGSAYKKFMEIIDAQGGLKKIPEAKIQHNVLAKKDGVIKGFDNKKIAQICRYAGCPDIKESGIFLHKHLGDNVKKGDALYTIHTNSDGELKQVLDYIKDDENIIEVK